MSGISGTVPPHITHLNDIGDINVPAPVDGYIVYWDAAAGKWQCQHVSVAVAHLNDVGDVNVPAPTDQYFLYWDNVAGRWQCRSLIDADIPATIARDVEVAADIATHTALSNAHHAQDHAASHEPGGGDAMAVDAIAATGSLRTLGAGAQQAMPGNATPTPAAHAASHENGGGDEVSVLGLSGLLADGQTPLAHAASHEPGGGDAMAVDAIAATGSLRTLGAGAQQAMPGNAIPTPAAHAASHENGGGDEVSVLGLSGLLADGQTPLAHAASHEPGGGDAMAVDAIAATGSLRTLGAGAQQAMPGNATPTPAAHAASHNWLGADEADYWQALLSTHRLCIFDGQAPDMWTSHTDGVWGSVAIGLLKTVLATGANLAGYAHLQTTAAGHGFSAAATDVYIKWLIRFENATSHADETAWVWVSKTNGATLPNSGQRYAGFKLVATAVDTFRVYACSADAGGGANEEITDTGIDIVGMWSPDISLVIAPTGTGHAFYVDGVLAATHSTYVPTQGNLYCHQRIDVISNNGRSMRLINICFME